jgi:hypothetical protein
MGRRAPLHARTLEASLSTRQAVALAAGLTFACTLISAAGGLDIADEMWFLQVTTRVAHGDVLYRDVFFGSTPMAVWIALPGVALTGSEVLVVKALTGAGLAAAATALAVGAGWAGISTRSAVLLAAATAIFAARVSSAPYVTLAMGFAAWAVVAAAAYRRRPDPRLLLAAGALVGAAASTKYTIGGLAGLCVAALVVRRRDAPATVLRLGLPFTAVLAAALAPVLLTGGGPRFVEYGFAAKGRYLEAGRFTFADAVMGALRSFRDALSHPSLDTYEHAVRGLAMMATLAGVALVAVALRRAPRERRPLLAFAVLLAAASVVGAYPRFTTSHLSAALPGTALLVAVACHALLPRGERARTLVLGGVAAWVAVNLVGGLIPHGANPRVSTAAHIFGVAGARADLEQYRRDAAGLVAARRSGPVLMVGPDAGLRYLLSGVENPTAFDYPYVTAFGRHGEERTAARIVSGDIPSVCLDTAIPEEFRPRALEAAIVATLRPGRSLGRCVLYGR